MTCKEDFLICPKCGSIEIQRYGYVILVKKRDKNNVPVEVEEKQKYKCKKCGHIWRKK